MGRKNIILHKDEYDDYVLYKNGSYLATMCSKDIEKMTNLNIPNESTTRIDSIKFVGLRKVIRSSKAKFFLTKDKNNFIFWSALPKWDNVFKQFNVGEYIKYFPNSWFEKVIGLRKQARLKMGDIYSFSRIEVKTSEI